MHSQDLSIIVDEGDRSQTLAISATSAQSAVILGDYVLVTPTVATFVRQGVNPTATNDGTDIYLLAGVSYRLNVRRGNRLAFRTASETGAVYVTPGV